MSNQNTLAHPQTSYFTDLFNYIADSWNQGDRGPYVDNLASDAVYMVPNSETLIGTSAIREFVEVFPDVTSAYEVVNVWGTPDIINVHGKWSAINPDGTLLDKGKFIAIFSKDSVGTYKITHTIWNSDLPLP